MKNFEVVNTEELKNIKGGMSDKAIVDDCLV
jgi:bacteriocin-like protein